MQEQVAVAVDPPDLGDIDNIKRDLVVGQTDLADRDQAIADTRAYSLVEVPLQPQIHFRDGREHVRGRVDRIAARDPGRRLRYRGIAITSIEHEVVLYVVVVDTELRGKERREAMPARAACLEANLNADKIVLDIVAQVAFIDTARSAPGSLRQRTEEQVVAEFQESRSNKPVDRVATESLAGLTIVEEIEFCIIRLVGPLQPVFFRIIEQRRHQNPTTRRPDFQISQVQRRADPAGTGHGRMTGNSCKLPVGRLDPVRATAETPAESDLSTGSPRHLDVLGVHDLVCLIRRIVTGPDPIRLIATEHHARNRSIPRTRAAGLTARIRLAASVIGSLPTTGTTHRACGGLRLSNRLQARSCRLRWQRFR